MSDYTIPRPVSGDVVDLILDDHRLFEALMRDLRDSSAELLAEPPLAAFGVAFAAGWLLSRLGRSER